MSTKKVHPVDICPPQERRSYSELAEQIAISWIDRSAVAPPYIRQDVHAYPDLDFFRDTEPDPEPIDRLMNAIYDRIMAAATARCRVSVDKQVRRIERTMPYQEQCNRAIARWRMGEKVS